MYDHRMRDYLQYLADTPEQWVPLGVPKLNDECWAAAFVQAGAQGKTNIAHAWLWELNLMLDRKNYHRPSPGLISILQEHAQYVRMFGGASQAQVTKDWLVTGSPENLAHLMSPKVAQPVLTSALKLLWSDDHVERVAGICALEPLVYHDFERTQPIPDAAFKLLHDLVWDTLGQDSPSNVEARFVGYQLIVRLDSEFTYKGPDGRYANDPTALAWHRYSHVGGERTLLNEHEACELRAKILNRPVKERFCALVYLARSWCMPMGSTEYIELGKVVLDEDTIYNWDRLGQATVANILCMWLPELAPSIELAQATDIYLHELGNYFLGQDVDVNASLLPRGEYC